MFDALGNGLLAVIIFGGGWFLITLLRFSLDAGVKRFNRRQRARRILAESVRRFYDYY